MPSLTQEQLASRLGVKRPALARWESLGSIPELHLQGVARFFGVPAAWFLDPDSPPPGFGPTAQGQPAVPPGFTPPNPLGSRGMVPGAGRSSFPVLGTAGAAAAPHLSADADPDDYVEFSDSLFRADRFAIRVQGDSMEPRLQHGDFVLVQPAANPAEGLLVVVKCEVGHYLVKVLRHTEDGPVLESLNPAYATRTPANDWEVVGYAVGMRREMGPRRYVEEGDDGGMRA